MEKSKHHGERDFSVQYVCKNCETSITPEVHCGKAMEVKMIDDILNFVCWKGIHKPCCGKESHFAFEKCCSEPDLELQLNDMLLN